MSDIELLDRTRESITLGWTPAPGMAAYSIERIGPIRGGRKLDDEPHELLGVSYVPRFCDTDLQTGARYAYHFRSIPDPTVQPEPPADEDLVHTRTLPETEYVDCMEWFERFMRPMFPRELSDSIRWCEQWWRHPEALYVVHQMWQSYEAMRSPEPPAPPGKQRAEWLVVFFYPLLAHLVNPAGPFAGCAITHREMGGEMHHEPPKTRPLLHVPVP